MKLDDNKAHEFISQSGTFPVDIIEMKKEQFWE